MKTYLKNIAILLIAIPVICSCKKMDDSYKQFYEEGETIYIGRADSVLVRGGNNRIEVSWLLLSDPKVSSYKMYWNNYQDSIVAEVTKSNDVDTVRVLLEDMREGMHHFEIIMFDRFGNNSVPTRVAGRAYGEQYSDYLVNRVFKNAKKVEHDNLELSWVSAEDDLLFTTIEYDNIDDEKIVYVVHADKELDTLKKFPVDGTFRMRSAYMPEALAIDTFYSKIEVFKPL